MGDREQVGRAHLENRPVLEKVVGAIIFGVIFLGTLLWGALPFTFGVALAAVIGSVELFSMFETRGEATPTAAVVGIAASIAYVFLAHYKPIESIGFVTVGLVFLSLMWYMLVLRHVKPTKAVALTVFAPLLAGFCLSYLVLLRDYAGATNPDKNNGWWLVVFLMALIWIYDVFAWMVGRKIGRHKMAPEISPNKSWEGTIAGTVGTLLGSIALWAIIRALMGHLKYGWFSIWVALIIACIVCVFGPLGDLAESMMKREYAMKDMGRIIPGAGGVMDRFDSTLFTAPVVFFYLFYFVFKI